MTAKLWTAGEIARNERVPIHRVSYAIDAYGIEPVQRAGIIRLFDDAAVARIRSALKRIRNGSGGGL